MLALVQKLASKSTHHQHHHAVIVTKGGSIIAMGYNCGSTHAEVNALNKMWPSERKGVKVWSFRLRKNGTLGMAKPCSKCEKYLVANGVKVVYYTNDQGDIEKMKL